MIHILGLACVVFGLVLCAYYFLLLITNQNHEKNSICVDDGKAVEIVKLLEALREVCPPGSGNGWNLLSSSIGLRCWWRKFPYKFLNSEISVYASSTVVNVPAVVVLNVVADLSTWPEWDPVCQQRQLEAELSEDPDLHGDKYMQCDQVVTMTAGHVPKPGILMHRFGNLESNGVGWLLFWHIRRLDWTFFLAQPVESSLYGESSGCQVSMVRGCNPYQKCREDLLSHVALKLRNLKEALLASSHKFHSFRPLQSDPSQPLENPHYPTVRSALVDLSEKPCLLLRPESYQRGNHVLAAVPFADSKPVTLQNVKGYVLVPWCSVEEAAAEEVVQKGTDRPRRRPSRISKSFGRSDLYPNEGTVKQAVVVPMVQTPSSSSSSSSSSSPVSERKNKSAMSLSSPSSLLSHIFRRRSSEQSNLAVTDEESSRSLRRSSSNSALCNLLQKSNLDLSTLRLVNSSMEEDTIEETFLLVPNLQKPLGNGEQYKLIGNACASQVAREVIKALEIDVSLPHHEQKRLTGGWVCEGIHKQALVLTKISTDDSSKTVSYLNKGVIPIPAAIVWKTICNPLARFMYDETVKQVSILQELSTEQKIVYAYHESISLLKKEAQDFCLLHTQNIAGTSYVLALQSVEHGSCPAEKDAVRGTLLPSGWIVEPLSENEAHSVVTYLIQVTVHSSDSLLMEEMGTMHCVSNLRSYLTSKPKKRF